MTPRPSLGAATGWALLLVTGQAAALSLIHAGRSVGYQHYLPIAELPSRPIGLAVVLAQGALVVWGLSGVAPSLIRRVRQVLPTWRLPALILMMAASAATVGRDLPRWLGESALSLWVQCLSLCTVVLFARALPDDVVERLRRWRDALLGSGVPVSDDEAPRVDRFALITAALVVLACALLAVFVYERHPHLQDEVAYLFQARTLATGRIALPNPPVPRAFELFLIATGGSGWYSPVPPGWAAALVPGVLLGVPWLVNPVLSGVNILLGYLVLQPLIGRRSARLTTLLLAMSPWSLFLGMSFMPHTFTLSCALVATLGVMTARRTGHARWAWLGGSALGVMASVRQLDAMVMAAALGLWSIGLGGRRLRATAIFGLVLGSMVLAAPLLPYNRHFTGKPGYFPMMAYNDSLFGKGANDYGFGKNRGMGWALDPNPGHGPVDGVINATLNVTAMQPTLFGWAIGSLLVAYLSVVGGAIRRADRLMLGVIALTFTAYFFNYFAGGPDFGARYWYLMVVPLGALTASGVLWVGPRIGSNAIDGEARTFAALALLAFAATVTFVPWSAVDKYWHYRGMRPDLRALHRERHFAHGLVLVAGRELPDYASAAALNPLDLRAAQPIFARRRDAATDSAVILAFADRPVWLVDGPSVTRGSYVVRAGPLSSHDALALLGASHDTAVGAGQRR